jgi:signal-transduction protein with cAMP-binding, CBS, and nucleotidyltransferase domain
MPGHEQVAGRLNQWGACRVRHNLETMCMKKISDIVNPPEIFWVEAEDTIREAVQCLCEHKTGAVVVCKGAGHMLGVFSERDLMHRVVNKGLNPDTTKVKDVMSTDLVFIHANDEIQMAKAKMHTNNVRHLLVVDEDNKLLGLVSLQEIVSEEMADSRDLVKKLNDQYYETAYKEKWSIVARRIIIEAFLPKSKV